MLFWIVAALLTLGACLAILLPFSRCQTDAAADRSHDIEVYRDQLAELDRDARRGVIGTGEAEEARAEIARRLIRAGSGAGSGHAGWAGARWLGVAGVLAVPLVAWSIYVAIGSPSLPGQPLQARLTKDPGQSTVEELVARAEAHLANNPDDAHGWDVLAPVYLRLGRFDESAAAYRNAIRLDRANAARESGLGEALTAASGGVVTTEARSAFERALAIDAADAKSRYFLATAKAQEGAAEEAVAGWRALADSLPAGSQWRDTAERAVAQAQQAMAASGPQQTASTSGAEQGAMIENMVSSLDARLREEPGDAEGWKRLVRSYIVLGRPDEARDALARGRDGLGPDSPAAEDLLAFARSLGLVQATSP